ncbi:MAG: hypothetical protein R6W83_05045 [Cryobacterium sp.]
MNQPYLWGGLLAFAIVVGIVRFLVGRPFWPHRAVPIGPVARTVAVLSALALVFHCAAMFFTPWVTAVGFLEPLARSVNAMGVASQVAYWVPAALLLGAWARVWWPGLLALALTLAGVGITMYWSYPLVTHLWWLGAVIVTGVFVSSALVGGAPRRRSPGASGGGRTR